MVKKKKDQEILGPDGRTYILKKALHERPLFWLLLLETLLLLFSLAFSGILFLEVLHLEGQKTHFQSLSVGLDDTDLDIREKVSLGKKVDFEQGNSVTVQSIKEDADVTLSDDASHKAIVVEVKIANKGQNDYSFSPYDFELYDQDEVPYILDSSTLEQKGQQAVLKPGQEGSYRLIFDGEQKEQEGWSLLYKQTLWTSEK